MRPMAMLTTVALLVLPGSGVIHTMKTKLALLSLVFFAGCGSSAPPVCPDDGNPDGPVCMVQVESDEEFVVITREAGYLPNSDRITKYMAPAKDDPDLLPTIFQNLNRYHYHIDFLKTVFDERFSDLDQQKYLDLILQRETRRYFSGNIVRIDDPGEGILYGFTVYTAASNAELLEVDEVHAIYDMISEVFLAGKLVYTFDPPDAMARQKALEWENPGFPIYSY